MTFVSMNDFRPPGRSDGLPWTQILIEESATNVGSGTLIDTKVIATGPGVEPTGLDVDPRYPQARDWTTVNATLAPGVGYYRVRFKDASGIFSEYSDWVSSTPIPWFPSLREVAVHIRNRTVERSSNKFLGTFTNATRPSDEEAWEAIELALNDIIADTGRLDRVGITADSHRAVRSLAALRAAMIIERSYYGEQIGANKSPYPALERDWERRLPKIVDAIAEDLAGEIEPTPDDGSGGGANPTTDKDLVVPASGSVLTKSGVWAREGEAQYTMPEPSPGSPPVDWDTKF
jgi:hypothetical protein